MSENQTNPAQPPPRDTVMGNIAAVGCAVILLGSMYGAYSCSDRVFNRAANDVENSTGTVVIGANTLGCRMVEDFRRLADLAAAHDRAAFNQAMLASIAAGRCKILDAGATAHREAISIRHGAVRVRQDGQTDSWWINDR